MTSPRDGVLRLVTLSMVSFKENRIIDWGQMELKKSKAIPG